MNHLYLSYEEKNICIKSEEYYNEYKKELNILSLHKNIPNIHYYETLDLDFDFTNNEFLYIVIPRFSLYDTFGCTIGYWEIKKVCQTELEADKYTEEIYENLKKYNKNQHDFKNYESWYGNWASLNDVEIHKLKIEE